MFIKLSRWHGPLVRGMCFGGCSRRTCTHVCLHDSSGTVINTISINNRSVISQNLDSDEPSSTTPGDHSSLLQVNCKLLGS